MEGCSQSAGQALRDVYSHLIGYRCPQQVEPHPMATLNTVTYCGLQMASTFIGKNYESVDDITSTLNGPCEIG